MQSEEEELIQRLNNLTLEKSRIERRLSEIKQHKEAEKEAIKDRDGKPINIGDTVIFLTKGKFQSSRGTVTKTNKYRVTAKDKRGRSISRAPHNLRKL
jgi:chaperonin cofactor prefoldin